MGEVESTWTKTVIPKKILREAKLAKKIKEISPIIIEEDQELLNAMNEMEEVVDE